MTAAKRGSREQQLQHVLKCKSGPETLHSDCQCDLCGFYLPSQLDGACTGLLTCQPLHFACYADVALVLKGCFFYSRLWHFFHRFKCLRCMLALWYEEKKKREKNEKASSFTWQFETKFSRRSSKVKDFCLTLSLQVVPPLLLTCSLALPLPFSSPMSAVA